MTKDQIEIFNNLLSYVERNTCLHDETHRGGFIWEICDSCGKKWADFEGGKPENAHEYPKEIEEAQKLWAELNKKEPMENLHCQPDKKWRISSIEESGKEIWNASLLQTYQPETIAIPTLEVENIVDALEAGLEHTQTVLSEHDVSLGRTTRKNQSWAETLEKDIALLRTRITFLNGKLIGVATH